MTVLNREASFFGTTKLAAEKGVNSIRPEESVPQGLKAPCGFRSFAARLKVVP